MTEKKKDNQPTTKITYEQAFKAARSKGETQQVSYDITKWEREGEVLIGKLLKVEKKSSKELGGKYDGEVNVYLFDTDEGLVSCVCGTTVDRIMGDGQDFIGRVCAIEFQGKRQLEGGREFNRFRVDIISMEGDESSPF